MKESQSGSPLFIETYDMVLWLLAHTQKFPKSQRFVLAKRMEEAALSFQDKILWATKTSRKVRSFWRQITISSDSACITVWHLAFGSTRSISMSI